MHNILQEIYRLVHFVSFSPEYIENLCPLDRELYWAYYLDEKKQNQSNTDNYYTPLDDNIPRGINM